MHDPLSTLVSHVEKLVHADLNRHGSIPGHDPDDLTQASLVATWEPDKGLAHLPEKIGLMTLLKHAANLIVGRNRSRLAKRIVRGTRREDPVSLGVEELAPPSLKQPETPLRNTERDCALDVAVKTGLAVLSPDQALIVRRRFFDDDEASFRQIAVELGLPPSTVHDEYKKALDLLKPYLTPFQDELPQILDPEGRERRAIASEKARGKKRLTDH